MRGWWGRQWEKEMRKERKSRQCCGSKGSHHELYICITATKIDKGVFKTKCGYLQNNFHIGSIKNYCTLSVAFVLFMIFMKIWLWNANNFHPQHSHSLYSN